MMGGGEAGAEAVLPIDLLKTYIRDEMQSNNTVLAQLIAEALSELTFVIENNISLGDKKLADVLVDAIIKKLSSTLILPIVLGYIIWLLKNQKHYRDANSKGTMILLKVKLFEYHDKYMELGSIPPYAFENFCDMYESYHELGGNGTGTKMYEEIKDLHLNKKKGD